jgi:type II secretory pathway pseudopilin PulG
MRAVTGGGPARGGGGRRGFTIAEAALAIVLLGVVASATAPMVAGGPAKRHRQDALQDLRAFARVQEGFFARHGRYAAAADIARDSAARFHWQAGAESVTVRTTRAGWSAEVRLPSGKRCALVVGAIRPPDAVPGLVAGIPACEP